MKFNKKMTISLSESDVKEIVADYMVANGFKVTTGDVKLTVEMEYRGYGMGEYQTAVFKECSVTVNGGNKNER